MKAERIPLNTDIGISQGMMPLIGYNYSSGNYKRMKEVFRTAQNTGVAVSLACIVMYELFAGPIMGLFIGDAATVSMGTGFLRARCLASVPMFLCFLLVFFFEALGMAKISLFPAVIRQLVFNIPLLLILNFVFGMNGIIWTQLIADACTAAVSYLVYRRVEAKRLGQRTAVSKNNKGCGTG